MTTLTLTATQRETLTAIVHNRFARTAQGLRTLGALEDMGLIFFDARMPIATRRGRRFLLAEAEAAVRASGVVDKSVSA